MLKQIFSGIEAGCDEAGRGCLAGPVFAAAVIIPSSVNIVGLNDSKKLSATKRNVLRKEIEDNCIWAVASCSPTEIDELNILWASVAAMHKALHLLRVKPVFIAVDGNKFKPWNDVAFQTVVKGDSKYEHIAAASILAKTHRDDYMLKAHEINPLYAWNKNKGYPSAQHRKAIEIYGTCDEHRKSFKML